jgi:hypothetical protein
MRCLRLLGRFRVARYRVYGSMRSVPQRRLPRSPPPMGTPQMNRCCQLALCLIVEGRSVAGARGESAVLIIGEQQVWVNLSPCDTTRAALPKSGDCRPAGYVIWWTQAGSYCIFGENGIVASLVRRLHLGIVFEVRRQRERSLSSGCSSQGARRTQQRSVHPAEQVPWA